MKAAMILGADGVQIGSRFAATIEASSHEKFKQKIVETQEGDTLVTLKELAPVRLIKNPFYEEIEKIYTEQGRNVQALKEKLGRGRAKKGMFEGNLTEGELEIGQVSALIDDILPVEKVFENLLKEFQESHVKDL